MCDINALAYHCKITKKSVSFIELGQDCSNQWFSTLGSWRPTKHKKTEFGDTFSMNVLL